MALSFTLLATDGQARRGRLTTPHGPVETPIFMPVGTAATVKGLTPAQLLDLDAHLILANTYHLALRPGSELIADLGGLHRFMHWSRPILTDSGGYQVFSLAEKRDISDAGVRFRSHIDGRPLELTPERAIAIQEQLGADIIMCLDECPSSVDAEPAIQEAMRRTLQWAERCRAAQRRSDQALFGIVQGGLNPAWRIACAEALIKLDFPGYALGGFSVGEPTAQMLAVLDEAAAALPTDKPRYLMGVGTPADLIEGVARGIDLFDCVLPTRNGRNAQAFTASGTVKLRNAGHRTDPSPLDPECGCYTCQHFSRAYLHHLFSAGEMLGPTLVSLHNIAFYLGLMGQLRHAIEAGRFDAVRAEWLTKLGGADRGTADHNKGGWHPDAAAP
ncbi:MAG TPA: tRNA guanosine(34) transglycosylase Tgt [Gemmatales bacterium]|nr:tRNA guanosine(34) transglycosylase Tgt [Gemmatales bacterium]HMP61241.1 tRNA guanosine(34) transglycosylase Tgt [Gemmatales bacterium]